MIFETWAQRLEAYAESKGCIVSVEEFRSYYDCGFSPEEAFEIVSEEEAG